MKSLLNFTSGIFISLVFSFLSPFSSFAQWEQVSYGIWGGNIFGLVENNGRIFAGTDGAGLYISGDQGNSWSRPFDGTTTDLRFIEVGNQCIYASGPGGLYKSSDWGDSWGFVYDDSLEIRKIAVNGDTIIGVFFPNIIKRSADGGLTWSTIATGTLGNYIYDVAFSGNNMLAGSSNGLYFSSNGGMSWTLKQSGTFNDFYINQDTVFAAGSGLYISPDHGTTWTTLPGFPYNFYLSVAVNQSSICCGTFNQIYISNDEGNTSTVHSCGLNGSPVLCLMSTHDQLFAGTHGSGVLTYINADTCWTRKNFGLVNYGISSLHVAGNSIFAGMKVNNMTGYRNVHIYKSDDDAATWQSCGNLPNYPVGRIGDICSLGSKVFASVDDAGIAVSTNDGDTWSLTTNGFPSQPVVLGMTVAGGKMFAATYIHGLYQSIDTGSSWTSVPMSGYYGMVDVRNASDTLFMSTTTNAYYSYNGGNLISFPYNMTGVRLGGFAIKGNKVFCGGQDGLYRSFDAGQHFYLDTAGLPNPLGGGDHIFHNTDIYAATTKGVYVSHNYGSYWFDCSANLIKSYVLTLAIKNGYLYAGTTSAGVWRLYIGTTSGISNIEPRHPLLIYPNPVQDNIILKFNVNPERRDYQILDVLGNPILTGILQETDENIIQTSSLKAGIYFISVGDKDCKYTEKFIKLK